MDHWCPVPEPHATYPSERDLFRTETKACLLPGDRGLLQPHPTPRVLSPTGINHVWWPHNWPPTRGHADADSVPSLHPFLSSVGVYLLELYRVPPYDHRRLDATPVWIPHWNLTPVCSSAYAAAGTHLCPGSPTHPGQSHPPHDPHSQEPPHAHAHLRGDPGCSEFLCISTRERRGGRGHHPIKGTPPSQLVCGLDKHPGESGKSGGSQHWALPGAAVGGNQVAFIAFYLWAPTFSIICMGFTFSINCTRILIPTFMFDHFQDLHHAMSMVIETGWAPRTHVCLIV